MSAGEFGQFLDKLEKLGALENTLVIMTGDHGMPFPRCKSNLYDSGARVPMAVQWPRMIKKGRVVQDFVSTTDLAPTFLEAAGLKPLEAMTGRSLMPIIQNDQSGTLEPAARAHVLTGKERHVLAQEAPDTGGTPMRAIRTTDYLLIKNYRTDRWPAGTPNHEKATIKGAWLADCDNGPAKTYMVDNRDKDEEHRFKYDITFGKRPEFELYDMKSDPAQTNNVAYQANYTKIVRQLAGRLTAELIATDDPRVLGIGQETFDDTKYLGGAPLHPDAPKPPRKRKAQKGRKRK